MNRELIKQYKAEFDHWLDGGTLLARRWVIDDNDGDASYTIWYPIDSAFWEAEKIFNTSLEYDKTQFVINDEYVEFRKALAEGKTIQYYVDGFVGWQDVTSVADHPMKGANQYRIKPDKHKFKVGDWVVHPDANAPWRLSQNSINHLDNSELEPWQPKQGEWFWYDKDFYKLESVTCDTAHTTFTMRDSKGYGIKHTEFNKKAYTRFIGYCEPFIGKLPNFIDSVKE